MRLRSRMMRPFGLSAECRPNVGTNEAIVADKRSFCDDAKRTSRSAVFATADSPRRNMFRSMLGRLMQPRRRACRLTRLSQRLCAGQGTLFQFADLQISPPMMQSEVVRLDPWTGIFPE